MPTNMNRTVLEEKTVDFFHVVRFSTGAFNVSHAESRTPVFSLTNTLGIAESGHLDQLLALLADPDTFKLQSRFRGGVKLELAPKFEHGLKLLLNSELSPSARLAYIVSFLHSGITLSDESFAVIFKARPDPLREIEGLFPPVPNVEEASLIKRVIFPDFMASNELKLNSDIEYRKYCLTVSFLSSPRAIRYGDFMKLNEENFFIPVYPRNAWSLGKLFAPIDMNRVEDLFPREYERFMRYFNSGIVRELRSWARARFDSGVETVKELQDKGVINRNVGTHGWTKVIGYLTLEEAKTFSNYIRNSNGISKVYLGCSDEMASLIAFFWVEGGEEKLNDLALHVSSSQDNKLPSGFGAIQSITLSWRNPFAQKSGRRPDLMPYVKALTDPELRDLPLEWALASY